MSTALIDSPPKPGITGIEPATIPLLPTPFFSPFWDQWSPHTHSVKLFVRAAPFPTLMYSYRVQQKAKAVSRWLSDFTLKGGSQWILSSENSLPTTKHCINHRCNGYSTHNCAAGQQQALTPSIWEEGWCLWEARF
jgi:hypothetical protein